MKQKEIRILAPEAFVERVRRFAFKKGRHVTHIVCDALTKYMEDDEAKQRQKEIERRFIKEGIVVPGVAVGDEPRRRRRRAGSTEPPVDPLPIPMTVPIVGDKGESD